jgi:hypothetical protein
MSKLMDESDLGNSSIIVAWLDTFQQGFYLALVVYKNYHHFVEQW